MNWKIKERFSLHYSKTFPLVSGKVFECGMVCGMDAGPPALASVGRQPRIRKTGFLRNLLKQKA
ncbi:MAG: hypothetical protein V5A47_09665, partial [Bacteroidales bacterium]